MKNSTSKKALITGISGQDGSYLAEYLLSLGYEVHGIARRIAVEDPKHRLWRLRKVLNQIQIHCASMESFPSLFNVIRTVKPNEIYHLAAQSFVSYSFEDEFSTLSTNLSGTHYMLAAVKELAPNCKFYFAGSSEMFGKVQQSPQNESTPFYPRSAYGISKVAGFDLTRNYREAYKMHACCGILFNHESPRRGLEFVTRKITSHAARIKLGLAKELRLGNLDAKRDWGHAKEYVKAIHSILIQPQAEDFVIATGKTHSVREFCQRAFDHVGLSYEDYVISDSEFFRPSEVETLQGDASKAYKAFGWKTTVNFEALVSEMVEADLRYFSKK